MAVLAAPLLFVGCAATVKIPAERQNLLHHAIFIRGDGGPANLVNAAGKKIDFDSLMGHDRHDHEPSARPLPVAQKDSPEQLIRDPQTRREQVLNRVWSPNYAYEDYVKYVMSEVDADSSRKHKLLIWIHGGRNLIGSSWKRTLAILDSLEGDRSEYFLLSLNWSSGDLPSYANHLIYSRPAERLNLLERFHRYILKPPCVLLWDAGRAVARLPLGFLQDAAREYTAAGESSRPADLSVDSLRFRKGIGDSRTARFGRVANGVITMVPRQALMLVPNTFGPGEWESLRRRTQAMFDPEIQLARANQPDTVQRPRGALSIMLDSLVQHTAGTRWEVTIVGHSMGSMVACEAIRRYPRLPVRNLVFMAAACRLRDFRDCVLPYLRDNRSARFYNLMLHPVNDLTESWAPVVGSLVYRGSLLTWIDDILTMQAASADRTMGREENALAAMRWVEEPTRAQITLKTFPAARPRGGCDEFGCRVPTHHGDFSDPRSRWWREEFWGPSGAPLVRGSEP